MRVGAANCLRQSPVWERPVAQPMQGLLSLFSRTPPRGSAHPPCMQLGSSTRMRTSRRSSSRWKTRAPGWLGKIYIRSLYPHNKRFVLYLISRISKWDSIFYLVQSLSETDERLVELSKRYVARWFSRYNRSFAVPSADQLKRLRKLLDERNLLVSAETEQSLESLMKSFG